MGTLADVRPGNSMSADNAKVARPPEVGMGTLADAQPVKSISADNAKVALPQTSGMETVVADVRPIKDITTADV